MGPSPSKTGKGRGKANKHVDKKGADVAGSADLRIVLVGKSGAGKSSTGNTILGETLFKSSSGADFETHGCEAKTKKVEGRGITVIDTPGYCCTERTDEELKPQIAKCILECAPGPHAFLIVLTVGRQRPEEKKVVEDFLKTFGEEVLEYAVVLFTHGDQLEGGQTIQQYVTKNIHLKTLVQKCGNRLHVIDNKYWNNPIAGCGDETRNTEEIKSLLNAIDQMVEQNGHYTNEMFKAVTKAIEKEKVNIRSADLRIVLVGKSGAGKSSTGNAILGEKLFKSSDGADFGTHECEAKTKKVNGRGITVIDTPGYCCTERPDEELKPQIAKCIVECAPGPHAFLIVLTVGRQTPEEKKVVEDFLKTFGEEVLEYAVVLFTRGNEVEDDKTIQQFVDKNSHLKTLVQKCGNRLHVIDNRYWIKPIAGCGDETRNSKEIKSLLNTIDQMVEQNGGKHYTNEMLKAVTKAIEKEKDNIRKETGGNLSENDVNEKAKNKIRMFLMNATGVSTGVLVGSLFGALAMPAAVLGLLEDVHAVAQIALGIVGGAVCLVAAPIGIAVGAIAGAISALNAGNEAETAEEAAENAFDAVLDRINRLCERAEDTAREATEPDEDTDSSDEDNA